MDLRVAAYAVIERRGKILLTHWRRGHLHGWTLPGGGIESGEDPKETVVREVLEETGLDARVGRLLGVDSRVMIREEVPEGTDPQLHTIRIVYRASVQDGPLRHEVDGSSDEARWVALKDIQSLKTLSLVQTGLRMAGLSRRGGGKNGSRGAGKSGARGSAAKANPQKANPQKTSSGKQGAPKQGGAQQRTPAAQTAQQGPTDAGGTTKASAARSNAGRSRSRGR